MKDKQKFWTCLIGVIGLIVLILDTKTCLYGATSGIQLCLRTVIPSLFPFFVFSSLTNSTLAGEAFPMLNPICKLCRIPYSSASILVLGFLGGYPVGAQCVSDALNAGTITPKNARRMLGFCSNAGPAFLFGMIGSLFSSSVIPWMLWVIHILSAIITGWILPGGTDGNGFIRKRKVMSLSDSASKAVHTIALVCSWVVLFRIIIAFCERWFLWLFPNEFQILIAGLLELSNGANALQALPSQSGRFVLSALMLGCGGICVGMQTVSIVGDMGTGMYFPGKLIQGCLSFLIAAAMQYVLFPTSEQTPIPLSLIVGPFILCLFTIGYIYKRKKENNSRNFSCVVI